MKKNECKTAMIVGGGGQDGHYLTKLLLAQNYFVVAVVRRSSYNNYWRLREFSANSNLKIEQGDVTDQLCMTRLIQKYLPNEIYNLASQSHVGTSYEQPHLTMQIVAGGCLNLLEAIRTVHPTARFYNAGTSEQFGNSYSVVNERKVQNEQTPYAPRSPYACAKQMAFDLVRTYRDAYNLWAVCPQLHNHESRFRAKDFVTRKITTHLAQLWAFQHGMIKQYDQLKLGNIDSVRDFGHASDYVCAMYLMMQQETPKDYVIGAGNAHSVREFLYACLDYIGLYDYEQHYNIDSQLFRPTDVEFLQSDSRLARKELKWEPKISFQEIVSEMMDNDMEQICHESGDSFSEFVRNKDRVLNSKGLLSRY